jgi:hypothetical protein
MRERLRARLVDESGIALVMALGIAMVLTLVGSALVLYSSTNDKEASRSKEDVSVYALAQSGIDSAVAQLGAGAAASADNLENPAYLTSLPAADRTSSVNNGSVTWTGVLCDDRQATPCPYVAGGPSTRIPQLRWHLTSSATLRNPAAAGNLTQTIDADIRLRPQLGQTIFSQAWKYVYSRQDDGNPLTCDETIANNPGIISSFYVRGDLCLDNSASFYGPQNPGDPAVEVIARGNIYLNHPSTSVGTNARKVSGVWTGTGPAYGCKFRSNPKHNPCDSADRVYIVPGFNGGRSQSPAPEIPAPVTSWGEWYPTASPGPTQTCDPSLSSGAYNSVAFDNNGVKDFSLPLTNFTSFAAFSCRTMMGELSWQPGNPGLLTINGTVYFDGSVDFQNTKVDYNGMGALYLSGSFRLRQSSLCAEFSAPGADTCASRQCATPGSGPCWDSEKDVLVVVAEGTGVPAAPGASVTLEQSSRYQGALFGGGDMTFENNTDVQGPMVAGLEIIQNSMTFHYIPTLVKVPFGMPGVLNIDYELTPPTNYAG